MRVTSPIPKKRARIEIIPLIDIIFFLLATFVMVSLSMTKNQGGSARVINRRSAISGAYRPPAISFRFMNKISLD